MLYKSFKLNKRPWFIRYDPTMRRAKFIGGSHREYDGFCIADSQEILLDPNADNLPLAFKHELVHSILYTMDHPLAENEDFVNAFSELLLEAETTLKERKG